MFVKCKACSEKVDRDKAYKVVVNGKNNYYCNEKEYQQIVSEKKNREQSIEIARSFLDNTVNTVLYKELSEIAKVHTYSKLYKYIENNRQILSKAMNRSFNSEYGKIRYFTTIIKNSIADYTEVEETTELPECKIEFSEVNYKPRVARKGFKEYME